MIVPNAEQIEQAVSELGVRGDGGIPEWVAQSQAKELVSAVGADSAANIGAVFPLTDQYQLGYMLGIQTARVVIASSVELVLKGADPKNVL